MSSAARIKSPCLGCEDRIVGCHIWCDKYIKYCHIKEIQNNEIREAKKWEKLADSIEMERIVAVSDGRKKKRKVRKRDGYK